MPASSVAADRHASARIHARVRSAALALLLLAPTLAAVAWSAWTERGLWLEARRQVVDRARDAAQAQAQLVALRLNTQFSELGFIAEGLIGDTDPRAMSPATETLVRRFIARHPELFAVNALAADGNAILWSTRKQPPRPITPGAAFTPLGLHSNRLLGQDSYAPRVGARVLTMRYRMVGPDGRTRYFIGSPYRLDALLARSGPNDFALTLRDQRDASVLATVGSVDEAEPAAGAKADAIVPLPGMPLAVEARAEPGAVEAIYARHLGVRLLARGLIVLLFAGAGIALVRMLREREREARRALRLRDLNALLGSVNQAVATADSESGLLQRFVDLAVERAGARLSFIARAGADGRFDLLAVAGPARGYLDEAVISTDPAVPEGQGAVGRVWHDGQAIFNSDFETSAMLQPWRELARRHGLRANAVLPIRRAGRVWAVWSILVGEDAVFGDDTREVLLTVAGDISHGLDTLAERALQQALLANTMAGIAVVRNRVIATCNARLAEMLGRSVEDLVGQPTRVCYPDEQTWESVGRHYAAQVHEGGVRLRGVPLACADGSTLPCDMSGTWLPGDGAPMVWTVIDVAERERQARSIGRVARLNAMLAAINRLGEAAADEAAVFAGVCEAAFAAGGVEAAAILDSRGTAAATSGLDGESLVGAAVVQAAWTRGAAVFDGEAGVMALPVHHAGRLRAVLALRCCERDLDQAAHGLLAEVAGGVGRALDQIAQRLRIEHLHRLHRALMAEGDVVLQARNVEDMLQRTCDRLVRGTLFHAVWIARPDPSGRFEPIAWAGAAGPGARDLRLDGGSPPARAWASRHLAIDDDCALANSAGEWAAVTSALHCGSALAAQVLRGGEPWAVLVFAAPQAESFGPGTVDVCQRVARLLGHGLDELDLKSRLQRLHSEEAQRARADQLTGLPNRYALEQHLPQALARARRGGTALAVGMLDLDDFKPVNDAWGHEVGDQLLRELGERLRARTRASDFLARLGGDEFVIVFEDLDAERPTEQLGRALARMHEAVETAFDFGQGRSTSVGLSLGVALFPSEAEEPESLLRRADAAMYQAKMHKNDRGSWWRGAGALEEAHEEAPFDPFGPIAAALLERTRAPLEAVADDFVSAFYDELLRRPEPAAILATLDAAEFAALRAAQAAHLRFVLHPGTTDAAIRARALAIGRAHALVGVSSAWLTESIAMYRGMLRRHLESLRLTPDERYHLTQCAEVRLQIDVQTELDVVEETASAYHAVVARPLPHWGSNWSDVAQAELDAIAALPGIQACELVRPDVAGLFRVEFVAGSRARGVAAVIEAEPTRPSLDGRRAAGQGLFPAAWYSGEVQRTDSYSTDARTAAWHEALRDTGIRSMAAIPVLDAAGTPEFVLAVQGAYPHQFAGGWREAFIAGLQSRWNSLLERSRVPTSPAVPQALAAEYRRVLASGGLEMHVQPVVDLRRGAVVKVEALARLRAADGSLLAPSAFLPVLRDAELDALFRAGLDQALQLIGGWDEQGIGVDVAVNLSPSTLLHPDCATWVGEALRRHRVAPRRLTLELLEDQGLDEARQDEAIDRVVRTGARLAMDDLGSGFSSLKRLASLPFHTIKVDQSLILGMRASPLQTMSLVRTVIQMGADFEREVVVEGLEDAGLIEAATILGAAHGQGYGIARPMPAGEFIAWARRGVAPGWSGALRTDLGALAWHWLGRHLRAEGAMPPASPLVEYLRGHGADEALGWHGLLDDPDPLRRREAAQRLTDWLVQRVTA